MACSVCEEFKSAKAHEQFYLSLPYPMTFDITKAEQILKDTPHEVMEAATSLFKDIIAYPPVEGKIYCLRIGINEGHLDHVDMSKPIIIVQRPAATLQDGDLVIDGHHRIARAMRDGLKMIKCVVLTQEETQSLLQRDARDNSPEVKSFLKRVAKRQKERV